MIVTRNIAGQISWAVESDRDRPHVPLDPMPSAFSTRDRAACAALVLLDPIPIHYWCTRPPDHTGRHAASNGAQIVAVWP